MGEDDPRLRVVFDCMIYIQAAFSESGPAAALLHLVDGAELDLFVCDRVLEEVKEVLSRPRIRRKNPDLTDERVAAYLSRIRELATVVEEVANHFTYMRDPKDEKYINLAVEAGVDYIVSRDRDLLDLMVGYTDECKDFRRRFRPLRVIEPVECLALIALGDSSEPAGPSNQT